jgi:HSP20 family protein
MPAQTALQPSESKPENKPLFVEAEKLLDQMREFSQSIGRRAYEFFETRGREFGHDMEDWFRAESELLRRVPVAITETDKQLTVCAEVPGFKAEEIKISVEPRRLVISGKSETTKTEETEQTVYNERRSNQFCRALDLAAAVDPAQTTATLKDGVLEVSLPKATVKEAAQVAVKAV